MDRHNNAIQTLLDKNDFFELAHYVAQYGKTPAETVDLFNRTMALAVAKYKYPHSTATLTPENFASFLKTGPNLARIVNLVNDILRKIHDGREL